MRELRFSVKCNSVFERRGEMNEQVLVCGINCLCGMSKVEFGAVEEAYLCEVKA